MKKIVLSLIFLLVLPNPAFAADYTFTLINKAGFEIIDLFFSPAGQKQWGEEVLTVDTIPNGEKIKVNVSRKEKADLWDIKAADEEGKGAMWPGIKISEISTLILTIKAGEPMAFSE